MIAKKAKYPLTAQLISALVNAKGIDPLKHGAGAKVAKLAEISRTTSLQWIKGEILPGAKGMRNLVLGLGYDLYIADEVVNFLTIEKHYPEEAPSALESLLRVVEEISKLDDTRRSPPGEWRPVPVYAPKTFRVALEKREGPENMSFIRKNATRFEGSNSRDPSAFFIIALGKGMTGRTEKATIENRSLLLVEPMVQKWADGDLVLVVGPKEKGRKVSIRVVSHCENKIVLPLLSGARPIILAHNQLAQYFTGRISEVRYKLHSSASSIGAGEREKGQKSPEGSS
ncbi:MAG: hypothetical protein JRI71_17360 [Deltaproteobacteria bacterium]|nr:hypothetical protein [Deltaproteobacteria bacterium]